ncbi:MAG: SEL1-like repeat protein, partial [Schleiferiaceae bacterium]|nr:SEL1-like repeat protein [Schleiferiaceae bacterium]
ADQGYAQAQYNLGIMYANGQGVPKSDKEAVKWYRKAAEQGDAMVAQVRVVLAKS